ncbi:restriction endonuclease PLD domain-containing protein [Lonepinella sp. MS14435]|uniref:restriction endonuclease PLD domain-containing protein n=1 Tax=unclassified Lonepinella TaxID=2642006 RepID=UPI0036DD97F6
MYKIALFLRTQANPNFFRNIVLDCLSEKYNTYILCSAFFQENSFSTSAEIINKLKLNINKHLDIYGLYRGNWSKQFNTSCNNIVNYANQNKTKLSVNCYQFKPNSHAKIFMAKENNTPKLAIIGSSNLSAGAFANRTSKERWNQESDVIFWNNQCSISNKIIENVINKLPIELKPFIYISNYNSDHIRKDISCQKKLERLEQLMKNNSIRIPKN